MYSSAVERLTADQQVPGSNPGAPFFFITVDYFFGENLDKTCDGAGHSSVGRAFDCRICGNRMVPGSIPGVRIL